MLKLYIEKAGGKRHMRQFEDELVTLGRAASNLVVLKDDEVSGRHAAIEKRDGEFLLSDLRSTNSTFVNGEQIEPDAPHPLQDGDVIAMGPFTVTVELHGLENTIVVPRPDRDADRLAEELRMVYANSVELPEEERRGALRRMLEDKLEGQDAKARLDVLSELGERFHRQPANGSTPGDSTSVPGPSPAQREEIYVSSRRTIETFARQFVPEIEFSSAEEIDQFGQRLEHVLSFLLDWMQKSLEMRAKVKEAFDADFTRIGGAVDNPLKKCKSGEQLAHLLLDPTQLDDKELDGHLQAIFSDMVQHQAGMLQGVQQCLKDIFSRLSPEEVEKTADQNTSKAFSPFAALGKMTPVWKEYSRLYHELFEESSAQDKVIYEQFKTGYTSAHARQSE